MSVSRAQSWPLLNTAARGSYNAASVDDSFLKEKSHPTEINDNGDKSNIAADQLDDSHRVQARRLLCRHYYPEGGWGWVVTFVGTLVHLLASGLQFSIPATVALPAKVKFYHHPWHTAGYQRTGEERRKNAERDSKRKNQ
ncbi:Monocarboxylate transporter 12-like isoform x2 protein [Camponotus japonicus]